MDLIITEMTSTATIAIAAFGIAFCLVQTEYSRVNVSFAAFLAAVAVNNVPDAFARMIEPVQGPYVHLADIIFGTASSLCLAPLFWIYVYAVTSTAQRRPPHAHRHLYPAALTLLVGLAVLTLPTAEWAILHSETADVTAVAPMIIVMCLAALQLFIYPQLAIYLYLIVRRLMRHRLRLRDVYASTEQHELRWIYVICGLAMLFWLFAAVILMFAFADETADGVAAYINVAGLVGLALVASITLWGVRQRPPLMPDPAEVQQPTVVGEPPLDQPNEKYKNSALSTEASNRITRKLRNAMESDRLYRDANLSLWALARHIGASPNYISQTLNEVIGESFFDFVNGYRIAEAMTLLSTTNDTVLNITYDVGFNARSSFYNAFKRVTGETPTSYRRTQSQCAGMDDITA